MYVKTKEITVESLSFVSIFRLSPKNVCICGTYKNVSYMW